MPRFLTLGALASSVCVAAAQTYTLEIVSKAAVPAMSIMKAVGSGYSPCEYTFNPAFFPPSAGLNQSVLFVRVAKCPDNFGGAGDHIMFAYCSDDGTCGDLQPLQFPFAAGAEDPRVVYLPGYGYMLYIYAGGSGQSTVFLYTTLTPLDASSWKLVVGALPWHRNGCLVQTPNGTNYVIFGESPPLPGLGIATTTNFVNYTTLDSKFIEPLGANNTAEPEIVVEASTAPVRLSTGDYLHFYSAGTPGWVPNGNYTGGWVIMDGSDPTRIKQRSESHLFVPTMDYEIGNGIWPVQRNRTIFVTSAVPISGEVDVFRVWYGAADANVASAIVKVSTA